jgi:hypothetical protein
MHAATPKMPVLISGPPSSSFFDRHGLKDGTMPPPDWLQRNVRFPMALAILMRSSIRAFDGDGV